MVLNISPYICCDLNVDQALAFSLKKVVDGNGQYFGQDTTDNLIHE